MNPKKSLSLRERFGILKEFNRIARHTERLKEIVREAEGAECTYCGEFRVWDDLTDESTQEQERLICKTCIQRRQVAHESGWLNWPERN